MTNVVIENFEKAIAVAREVKDVNSARCAITSVAELLVNVPGQSETVTKLRDTLNSNDEVTMLHVCKIVALGLEKDLIQARRIQARARRVQTLSWLLGKFNNGFLGSLLGLLLGSGLIYFFKDYVQPASINSWFHSILSFLKIVSTTSLDRLVLALPLIGFLICSMAPLWPLARWFLFAVLAFFLGYSALTFAVALTAEFLVSNVVSSALHLSLPTIWGVNVSVIMLFVSWAISGKVCFSFKGSFLFGCSGILLSYLIVAAMLGVDLSQLGRFPDINWGNLMASLSLLALILAPLVGFLIGASQLLALVKSFAGLSCSFLVLFAVVYPREDTYFEGIGDRIGYTGLIAGLSVSLAFISVCWLIRRIGVAISLFGVLLIGGAILESNSQAFLELFTSEISSGQIQNIKLIGCAVGLIAGLLGGLVGSKRLRLSVPGVRVSRDSPPANYSIPPRKALPAEDTAHRRKAKKLNDMAVGFIQDERPNRANEHFRRAIATDPTWSVSHLNYARFLFSERKFNKSARILEIAVNNAKTGTDLDNDVRVLEDAYLLEGALAAHDVGKGTAHQFFAALANAHGKNVDEYAPTPNESSKVKCSYCRSRITRQAPVHALLPVKELKGASQSQRDHWYKSLGRSCDQCGKTCCGHCYANNGQKCPNCQSVSNFFRGTS